MIAAVFHRRKGSVGASWCLDETYIKVPGKWKYFYRALDRDGGTVDFLLSAKRNEAAAIRLPTPTHSINLHGVSEKITIDKIGANTAVVESVKTDACVDILMRHPR